MGEPLEVTTYFLRILLKEVAKKNNMFITFMPKPTIGDWRSGAHINFSMEDVNKPGKNIFTDGQGWSKNSKYRLKKLVAISIDHLFSF